MMSQDNNPPASANPLKDARAALDTAVLTAYGFSVQKDLPAQLLTLNRGSCP